MTAPCFEEQSDLYSFKHFLLYKKVLENGTGPDQTAPQKKEQSDKSLYILSFIKIFSESKL